MKKRLNDVTPEEWDQNQQDSLNVSIVDTKKQEEQFDVITRPEHYNKGGMEAIKYIEQQLGENFFVYCEGNVMKYLHRWRYKDHLKDLKKAQYYLEKMITTIEDSK